MPLYGDCTNNHAPLSAPMAVDDLVGDVVDGINLIGFYEAFKQDPQETMTLFVSQILEWGLAVALADSEKAKRLHAVLCTRLAAHVGNTSSDERVRETADLLTHRFTLLPVVYDE